MPDVIVAVPTFKRPRSLKRLLDALARLDTHAKISVLVADNDAEHHEGLDLCAGLGAAYRWPLEAFVVPERGIAQVRNALVARALRYKKVRFVAMLDDDEWPSPDWLDAFLKVQDETGADALQGSILFARAPGQADWAANREGVSDIRHATGPVDMLQGAGNLLLTRACLESLTAPWFDPAFALTGGEDRDFFVRLQRAGKRFAWADEAIAHGEVPAIRLSLRWVLARAYGVGNSDMRVILKHWPGTGRLAREWAKIAGAVLLSPVLFVILAAKPNRRFDALALLFRAAGKASAMFGRHYDAYSVTHGE
jgi:GT2 family glycosyltransferase